MRLFLLAFLIGCGPDVSVSKVKTDADNDGYDESVDCDDAAQSVHPEADELCDGVDQDCDGVVDEDATDATSIFTDADGDGYGDADTEESGCEPGEGQSGEAGDCDDGNATVNPGAAEICNAIDDDCDEEVDEDASDALVGYADTDGDGYGDESDVVTDCALPDGYVVDATDCDDTADDVYPGAPEPDCTDPVDHDCDGETSYADEDADGWAACEDCDDTDATINPEAVEICDEVDNDCDTEIDGESATDAATWYRDTDTDGWGDDDATRIACEEPSGYAAIGGDCDDLDAARSPSEVEVCDAADLDEDCSGDADDADTGVDASTFSTFARDSDADTFGDPGRTVTLCDAPSGYVLDATDCDDTNTDVFPGATEVCNGIDDDCDTLVDDDDSVSGTSTWYADTDGDDYGGTTSVEACEAPSGYVAVDGDCDDASADVSPEAPEVCNGDDDDCDGLVDDDDDVTDPSTWYRDADGDDWGRSSLSTTACVAPAGYVANVGDCDDADSLRNPGETEVCDDDNLDEDCSGTADDDDAGTDASTFVTWARDADSDTFGDPGRTVTQCDAPTGYVDDATDCDDADAAVFPGAVEVCNGLDDDCDTLVDDDDTVSGTSTWYADTDTDGYGGTSTVRTCDPPAGYVADGGDCDDASAAVNPDATEVCNDVDDDCDGLTDDADTVSGTSTWYADADADTYGDPASTLARCDAPAGYGTDATDCDDTDATVYPGATEVEGDGIDQDCDGTDPALYTGWGAPTVSLADADLTLRGTSTDEWVGYALAAPDLDGDGLADVVCGARNADIAGTNDGAAFLFYGGGHSGEEDMTDADVTLGGEAAVDAAGTSVADLGDMDGDGIDDLLVSAHFNDSVASGAGRAYVVSGNEAPGMGDLGDAWAMFSGQSAGDYFGYYLGSAGDVDGDGLGDAVVGASFRDEGGSNAGKAYLFLADSIAAGGSFSASAADYSVLGDQANDYLGEDVGTAGDIDGDGLDDLALGATQIDDTGAYTYGAGRVYLFLGGSLGSDPSLDATDADTIVLGEATGDAFGQAIGHGDFDGDNRSDLAVSAYLNDDGATTAGANYVFLGIDVAGASTVRTTDAAVVVTGDAADDELGVRSLVGFDIDLDGLDDLFTGAIYSDLGGTNAGTAALFLSPTLLGSSTLTVSDADFRFYGETASDRAGAALATGDVDGDTVPDLLVGAHRNDVGASDAGATYVLITP